MPPDVESAAMSAPFEESDGFVKILMECRGRRLFRTKTGHIDLGPVGLKLGDIAVTINGTSTPFLFRETDSKGAEGVIRGALVGECYIDGIMTNEYQKEGNPQMLVLM